MKYLHKQGLQSASENTAWGKEYLHKHIFKNALILQEDTLTKVYNLSVIKAFLPDYDSQVFRVTACPHFQLTPLKATCLRCSAWSLAYRK